MNESAQNLVVFFFLLFFLERHFTTWRHCLPLGVAAVVPRQPFRIQLQHTGRFHRNQIKALTPPGKDGVMAGESAFLHFMPPCISSCVLLLADFDFCCSLLLPRRLCTRTHTHTHAHAHRKRKRGEGEVGKFGRGKGTDTLTHTDTHWHTHTDTHPPHQCTNIHRAARAHGGRPICTRAHCFHFNHWRGAVPAHLRGMPGVQDSQEILAPFHETAARQDATTSRAPRCTIRGGSDGKRPRH